MSHFTLYGLQLRSNRAGWLSGNAVDIYLEIASYSVGTSAMLNVFLHDFLHNFHANVVVVAWLGHYKFLSNPFQFTIYESYHSTLYNADNETS
jgi:hypothetical protein